jgi:hypothetical protein
MVFNNNLLLGAAGQGGGGATSFDPTLIGNSVWLDGSSDQLEMAKTSGGSASSKFTVSCWIRRNEFSEGTFAGIFGHFFSSSAGVQLYWSSSNTIVWNVFSSVSGSGGGVTTSEEFRDIGWYHILANYDGTNGTMQLFVNGESVGIDTFTPGSTNPIGSGTSGAAYYWGAVKNTAGTFGRTNSYLAQCALELGTAAVPSDYVDTFTFGTNGSQIIPKNSSDLVARIDSAGGHSHLLDFADSADLGNDISSNANDFTPTSMSSVNQTTNTPSLVFPTFSALNISSLTSLSEGNLKAVGSGSEVSGVWSTRPISAGETIYFEGTWGSTSGWGYFGVSSKSYHSEVTSTFNSDSSTHIFQLTPTASNRGVASAGSALFTGQTTWTTTDTFQIAIDIDNGKLWFGVNDSWYDSGGTTTGDPVAGTNPTVTFTAETPMFVVAQSGGASSINVNFGQDSQNVSTGNADENGYGDFEFAPPSGFLAFCSANLTAPDYQGIDYFNATLYTGNGTAIGSGGKAVTGTGFQPDLVWIKNRDAADSHAWYDIARGTTKQIESDNTSAETTESEGLTTFGSDGFTVGNLDQVNTNTEDYVAWQWLGSNSTSTNTNGSLNTTVTTAGADHFSIVSWTMSDPAGAKTLGHGLTAAPELIIVKNRTDAATNWPVYSEDVGNTKYMYLSTTAAATTFNMWQNTSPTSTVFSVSSNNEASGSANDEMIAYCFRSVPGVCKVGSYEGNGSTDGTIVSLGFKPAFVLFKSVDSTSDWQIFDKSRNGFNIRNNELEANDLAIEDTSTNFIDLLSDGFKFRIATDPNVSETYIYLAMADIGGNGTLPPIYGR